MKMPIKIGLLEFGDAPDMEHEMVTINNVLAYAQQGDALGFSRMWLAEHYGQGRPWYNQEVLLPLIAAMTDQIRVGAAGILLSVHSPYRVAMTFQLLNNLFSERIDLGLARGLAPLPVAQALLCNTNIKDLSELKELFNEKLEYLADIFSIEAINKLDGIIPLHKGAIPQLWSLARSYTNMPLAAKCKNNFCLSTFHINLGDDHLTLEKEKFENFRALYFQIHRVYPQVAIAFEGICHNDESRIQEIIQYKNAHHLVKEPNYLVGSPALFFDRLHQLQEQTGVDEFIFFNAALELEDKLHSLEILSQIFELNINKVEY